MHASGESFGAATDDRWLSGRAHRALAMESRSRAAPTVGQTARWSRKLLRVGRTTAPIATDRRRLPAVKDEEEVDQRRADEQRKHLPRNAPSFDRRIGWGRCNDSDSIRSPSRARQ